MNSECFKLGSNNNLLKVQFTTALQIADNESVLAAASYGGSLVHLKGFLPPNEGLIAAWWNAELDWEELNLLFSDGRWFRIKSESSWEEEQLPVSGLIEAKPLGAGFFALDSNNRFHHFGKEHSVLPSPACLQFNSPQCWCPLSSGSVVFAVENRIFVASASEVIERSCAPYGTICQITANEKEIVVLTVDGHCLVFEAASLQLNLDISVEFNVLKVDSLLLFDGICVARQSSIGRITLIDLVSEAGAEFKEELLAMIRECDGIRVITANQSWMIVRMPEAMQNPPDLSLTNQSVQERVKSLEEASNSLLELAFESGLQESTCQACEESMKDLKTELNEETFAYISATLQRRLDSCKLFWQLQEHFSLTPAQFRKLGKKFLKRLCQRDLHFEAFQLAIGLEWDMSELLTDWGLKVMKQKSSNEKELTAKIMDKLMTWSPHRAVKVDYLRLAEEAIRLQLNSLASQLLHHSPTSREKIELLVKVDAYEDALKVAINTGHQGEIKFVLDCLMKRLSLTVFLQLAHISDRVKAALYEYCQVNQPVLQQILLYQDDRLDELLASRLNDMDGDKVLELGNWFKMLRVQRCFEKRAGAGVSLLGLSKEACVEKLKPFKLANDFEESIK